jgi:MFS family permease
MLFTAAILGIFVYGMIAAMLGTILPDLSKKFSLSPKQNGNIALIQAVGLMIGSFSSGPLMDIYGKQVGMLLGLGLVALALIALRGASGYMLVSLSMLVLGLGGGVVVNGANSLNTVVNPDNPSSIANLLNLFFGLGGLVTPFVAANLFKSDTKKITFCAAVLALLALAASIVAPYPKPSGQMSFNFGMAASLLADPKVLLPALLLFHDDSFVGIRAGPDRGPHRNFPGAAGGGSKNSADRSGTRDGRHDIPDAAKQRREGRLGRGVRRRPGHGAGVPHNARRRGQGVHADRG